MSLISLTTVVVALVLSGISPALSPAPGEISLGPQACSQASRTSGSCLNVTGSVDSGSATIEGALTTPGSAGSSTTGSSTGSTPSSGSSPTPVAPRLPWSPPPPRDPVLGSWQCSVILAGLCRGQSPPKNPPPRASLDAVVAAPTPPRSLGDVASFSPGTPRIVIEPGAWSLPRLPTNIFSTASVETQAGELLGWPIEVRFTPRVFRWSYGEGSTAAHTGRGQSWGGNQFSATPTSHVYAAPGAYRVTLRVDYAVSYRFDGGPFVDIPGTLSLDAGATSLTVLRVSPVLVESGCAPGALSQGRCEGNSGYR